MSAEIYNNSDGDEKYELILYNSFNEGERSNSPPAAFDLETSSTAGGFILQYPLTESLDIINKPDNKNGLSASHIIVNSCEDFIIKPFPMRIFQH
eukprot:15346459-Ditylum_brightwellii.AAC.2